MASVNSPIRTIIKPLLFKLLGNKFYKYAQLYGKLKDIKYRLVEEDEIELLPIFVKQGDEVFDIGANYAYYTERLSKIVKENGKVYAFEPIPFTYDVCDLIVKKLKLTNVNLFQKGVADKNETVEFTVPKLSFGGISAGQAHISGRNNNAEERKTVYNFDAEEKIKCETVKVDDLLYGKLNRLSFIKIDIEGAEYYALNGMRKIIEKFKPEILIEIQPFFLKGFGLSVNAMLDLIKDMGYDIFYYNKEKKKIFLLDKELWDSNYILIHKTKINNFNTLINK